MEDADDLVVLAADKQMEETIRGLLSQHQALGIHPLSFEVYSHPNKDPGCRSKAHKFLRSLQTQYRRALVIFDYHGCGAEHTSAPEHVESTVEERLGQSGWNERARCLIIVPELEVWVWSDSREVDRCLGWDPASQRVRSWLQAKDLWSTDAPKPSDPKKAMEVALEQAGLPHSSSIFRDLAESVGLRQCEDESFQRFCQILREWFPPPWQQ
ncbi:methylation-associated defense system protein MAD4 [Salinibacter sp.]|uniref:methylation-associated defense system protein MAD4 n=1 Tax=Salinibacter sp. TaxID=2065818 RepID=UPI003FA79C17